jgi:nicotinamidase-related amidase
MTTLGNRPATALLAVDVQNAAVDWSYQRDAVVANIASLVEKARREHVPVIWVQHSDEELERGSGGWQIVPELNPDDSEPLVEKHYGDPAGPAARPSRRRPNSSSSRGTGRGR